MLDRDTTHFTSPTMKKIFSIELMLSVGKKRLSPRYVCALALISVLQLLFQVLRSDVSLLQREAVVGTQGVSLRKGGLYYDVASVISEKQSLSQPKSTPPLHIILYLDADVYKKAGLYFAPTLGRIIQDDSNMHITATSPAVEYIEDDFQQGDESCVPMKDWQTTSFPTCNLVHEIDMLAGINKDGVKYFGRGGMRLAWKVSQDFYDTEELEKDQVILKTLKWQRNYTAQIYEHNHIDVLASERLTALPNMIDIYGYCDQATLNELATGKDLVHVMTQNWTLMDLLQFATDTAWGIADTQNIDFPNGDNATLMHNNLDPANFLVAQDGRIKLSDFNLGKLLRWSTPLNARCAKGIFVEQLEWRVSLQLYIPLFSMLYCILHSLVSSYAVAIDLALSF